MTSEFKNKPDGWETTSKTQDGNIWEMSQREEDILVQEFERRIAFNKFQVCGENPIYKLKLSFRTTFVFFVLGFTALKLGVFRKQPLYLYEVVVRSAYTLPSPDPTCGIPLGNRRWGDNGYVRTGKQEARPAHRPNSQDSGAGSSRQTKKKETAVPKCEAADKVAAEKRHL
ncbi:hypothetical protein KY285_000346 [Solanum tuberosum]|nr:hypothetical protein KY285_000346 [Solanum tuberosum]